MKYQGLMNLNILDVNGNSMFVIKFRLLDLDLESISNDDHKNLADRNHV